MFEFPLVSLSLSLSGHFVGFNPFEMRQLQNLNSLFARELVINFDQTLVRASGNGGAAMAKPVYGN